MRNPLTKALHKVMQKIASDPVTEADDTLELPAFEAMSSRNLVHFQQEQLSDLKNRSQLMQHAFIEHYNHEDKSDQALMDDFNQIMQVVMAKGRIENALSFKQSYARRDACQHLHQWVLQGNLAYQVNKARTAVALIDAGVSIQQQRLVITGDLNGQGVHTLEVPYHLMMQGLTPQRSGLAALPDQLTVKGSLILTNAAIQSLPHGLKVGKDLILTGSKVTSFGEKLEVGRDLEMSRLPVRALPEDLKLGRHLQAQFSQLQGLPAGFKCKGDLDFSSSRIQSLPDHLQVRGSLNLSKTPLFHIGSSVRIGGDAFFNRTKQLEHLPEGLKVDGHLFLTGSAVSRLPAQLHVAGHLFLNGTAVVSLPDGLQFGGSLNIANTEIAVLPAGLNINGSLYAAHSQLQTLPEDIRIKGDIDLSNSKIRMLPETLRCNGSLYADHTPLTRLPSAFAVKECLNISYTYIDHLPENLQVGKHFNASFTPIEVLPDRMHVGGDVTMRHSRIRAITARGADDGFYIGGHLDFSDASALQSISEDILSLGRTDSGELRRFDVSGMPNVEILVDLITRHNNDDVMIVYHHSAEGSTIKPESSLADALAAWQVVKPCQNDMQRWQESEANLYRLKVYLDRLHNTSDAMDEVLKPFQQQRVHGFLQMLDKAPGFRAKAFELIEYGLESCDDGTQLMLNRLDVLAAIYLAKAAADPESALKNLVPGLVALEEVHRHAAAKSVALKTTEIVEVYLAYEIGCKTALNLPVGAESMIFVNTAKVHKEDIDRAIQAAQQHLAKPEVVHEYLAGWDHLNEFYRGQASQSLTWNKMARSDHYLHEFTECLISSRKLDEIKEPVELNNNLYELFYLMKHWVEKGTDPTNRQPAQLANIKKVEN